MKQTKNYLLENTLKIPKGFNARTFFLVYYLFDLLKSNNLLSKNKISKTTMA